MEGEHVTPDHQAIIEADGTMVPNHPEMLQGRLSWERRHPACKRPIRRQIQQNSQHSERSVMQAGCLRSQLQQHDRIVSLPTSW